MSTTRITIVKTAGQLGEAIDQLFSQHWSEIKYGELLEHSLHNARMQDEIITEKILSLTHTLKNHCDSASVVWFQQFIDAWTLGPCYDAVDELESLAGHVKVICSDPVDILLLTASDRDLAHCLKERIINSRNRRGCSSEWIYFLKQLRHCAIALQPFLESNNISTIKVIIFHVLGPSRVDGEIIKAATTIPEWFETKTGHCAP